MSPAVDEIDEMAIVQSESAPTSVTGSEHKGDRLEANPSVVRKGVHMASDARHVENLSSFFEVKGAKPSRTPSSRAGRGQRDVLRKSTGIASYLGPDRFDPQFATKELAQDMQAPSKLSMLKLRRFVRYLLGAEDVDRSSHTKMNQTRCWFGLMVTGVEML